MTKIATAMQRKIIRTTLRVSVLPIVGFGWERPTWSWFGLVASKAV